MKSILFFAKNHEMIKTNGIFFNQKNPNTLATTSEEMQEKYKGNFNLELDAFSYAFCNSRWKVLWTCMDFIDENKKEIKLYIPNEEEYETINLSELGNYCSFIVFKYLGSVEAQRKKIRSYLKLLKTHFPGVIINHPDTIDYAISKDYLFDLKNADFPVSETLRFPTTIKYEDLVESVKPLGKLNELVIKPITGELANSLDIVSEIGERWLRHKEEKVGGWMVQPFNKHIWNGEFRLVFFGSVCSHGLRKRYFRKEENQKIPDEKYRFFELYRPTDDELELARSVRAFWEKELKGKIYTFRFDFIKKRGHNNITILEFEAVNPGFSFNVLPQETRKRIAQEFVSYLDYNDFEK